LSNTPEHQITESALEQRAAVRKLLVEMIKGGCSIPKATACFVIEAGNLIAQVHGVEYAASLLTGIANGLVREAKGVEKNVAIH
jgi:hypothetical protein